MGSSPVPVLNDHGLAAIEGRGLMAVAFSSLVEHFQPTMRAGICQGCNQDSAAQQYHSRGRQMASSFHRACDVVAAEIPLVLLIWWSGATSVPLRMSSCALHSVESAHDMTQCCTGRPVLGKRVDSR